MSPLSLVILGTCLYLSVTSISPVEGQINYFGVAFSPYVKRNVNWDTYSLEEIKQMLRVILNYHNAVSTYGMGVAGYNNGKPWDRCDSNALIARAAAQINRDSRSVVLSVSQGIFQHDDSNLQQREINNAFSAAQDANSIWGGTVWGLTFTNEWVTDSNNGPKVLDMIRKNKAKARGMGLKVGTRVHTCGEIWGGRNQRILQDIARESDFIMCNLYPGQGANNPEAAVGQISDAYYSARDGFWRHNRNLEVQIGETGWASEGPTFNDAVNTVENMRRFWNGMKSWASQHKVKVQMFEAFDEPWKTGREGEKHFGWWYRPDNNQARYIEKTTGRSFS